VNRTRELSNTLASLRHEIAAREKSERRNQRLASELAHASRVSMMGHLSAGLAHEVNQPLATIANYVEACDVELDRLHDPPIAPRLRSYLDLTKKAALRAGQIVRRMRDFVRPNEPYVADVEINDLVREVVELCRVEANHTGSEILLRLTEQPAVVAADAIQIQQVLVNLVQNALQAMRDCPRNERRIEIFTDIASDSVQVEVVDTGPGYDTSDTEAVFAPFFTTKHDGLGIGLSICRAIIEQHAGTIWAEAAPGSGAKVCFTLPLSENHVEPARSYSECVCR
jgi:C4-dicarboxylate-specific signal transduction histidine kinase